MALLARAENAPLYTWRDITIPGQGDISESRVSPDGSKLFVLRRDLASGSANLLVSANDGASWSTFAAPEGANGLLVSSDGSKLVVKGKYGENAIYVSTDGGRTWVKRNSSVPYTAHVLMSPDGSFLVKCLNSVAPYTTHISTDDGQTWTQKGTNNISCPRYVSNNGTLIAQDGGDLARSTDYGQTWTETPDVLDAGGHTAFSNNGNNVFDKDRISLDGGNHWTPSNAPIPAGYEVLYLDISDDGKKLFAAATSIIQRKSILLTSVDGGRTWHSEDDAIRFFDRVIMSSNGSKLLYVRNDGVYRLGTLPTSHPVTPGAGAGGAATPSTGSTSATPGQKPGKASGRLAETGTSTWMVGGLAVVTVAAGVLVLRKRL